MLMAIGNLIKGVASLIIVTMIGVAGLEGYKWCKDYTAGNEKLKQAEQENKRLQEKNEQLSEDNQKLSLANRLLKVDYQ